jgi:hypothetical protein
MKNGLLSLLVTVAISMATNPSFSQVTTTLNRFVSAGADDAEEYAPGTTGAVIGLVDISSTDLELVRDGTRMQYVGLRFTNITIPQGATITGAYVQFSTRGDKSPGLGDAVIRAEAVDNALTFNTATYNISTRALGADSVVWPGSNDASWGTTGGQSRGALQRTTDITTLIQSVVNRTGWASGNAISFVLNGTGVRNAYSFNGGAADAPELVIQYVNTAVPTVPAMPTIGFPIPKNSQWYFLDNGSNPGNNWMQSSFDHSLWVYGPGTLGYGDNPATAVGFGSNSNNKYITTYFRKKFNVPSLAALTDTLELNLLKDDGAIIYINGNEVVRANMPSGVVGSTTTASSATEGADEMSYFTYRIPKSLLINGDNVIAAEVHQHTANSPDLGFDLELKEVPASASPIPPLPVMPTISFPIPKNSNWYYLDDGSNQGASWTQPGYSTAYWPYGAAKLGYSDGATTTISWGPSTSHKYTTYYFRKQFNVTLLAALYDSLDLNILADDGAIVYINGVQVASNNMPATWSYQTYASSNRDGADESTYFNTRIPKSMLVDGGNTIAVEVHQCNLTSSDLGFDLELKEAPAPAPPVPTMPVMPVINFPIPKLSNWYYLDNGVDPGAAWKQSSYNNGTWAYGPAKLGYNDGAITTLSWGPNTGNKYTTYYFRKKFIVTSVNALTDSLDLNLLADDGAIVYINGTEVARNNMPATSTYQTFSSSNRDGADEFVYFNYHVPKSVLVNGENTIAVEVHQCNLTSSDLGFDMELKEYQHAELLRGPYLQMATSNSMNIRWRTDVPVPSRVSYGTSQAGLTMVKVDSTLATDHEVKLTGLTPHTKYWYNIGGFTDTLQGDGTNYFSTLPVAGNKDLHRIGVFGDCGNNSTNQLMVRNQMESYLGTNDMDAWLLLGDNAYNTGTDADHQVGFFNMYNDRFLKQIPVFPAPGNHDYANNTALQANHNVAYYNIFSNPTNAECGGYPSGNEAYYSYNVGNIHFISLDSYGQEDAGTTRLYDTTGAQVLWLKNDLANNTNKDWVVVYFHHPPFSKGSHNSDTEDELVKLRENFVRILERYGVDLVLTGHSHSYERSRLQKGHYGPEATFDAAQHNLSASSGLYNGTVNSCPYIKDTATGNQGTIYVVAGTAGQIGGTTPGFPHNAMQYSTADHGGAMILEVQDNRLDAKYICWDGVIRDKFTIMKNVNKTDTTTISPAQQIELQASWVGKYAWNTGAVGRTITVAPVNDTLITVKDSLSNTCLTDSHLLKVWPPVNPGLPIQTFNRFITSGTDDAEEVGAGSLVGTPGVMDLPSSDLEMNKDGSRCQVIGLRFSNMNIPSGATITNAYIQFTTRGDKAPSSGPLTIKAEAADNPGTFTAAYFNISGRTVTADSVVWPGSIDPSWGTSGGGSRGLEQRTPNITSLIQNLVNRPGWASGNAMSFVFTGNGVRNSYSYNGSVALAPELVVQFSAPTGGTGNTVGAFPLTQGSVWKYLDNGTDQGTAWKMPAFNDTAWAEGTAKLGFSDGAITILGFGPSINNKYTTYYFRKKLAIPSIAALPDTVELSLLRDDGAIVYINGVEIVRSNMPSTAVNYLSFASAATDGDNEYVFFKYRIPKSVFVNGVNTIAVELHQNNKTSSDLGFDMEIKEGLAFTSCPANISINASPSSCSATTSYTAATLVLPAPTTYYAFTGATTGSGSGTGTGSLFNLGTTAVIVTALRPGDTSSCSFNVTVSDNIHPSITAPAAAVFNVDAGQCSATGFALGAPATSDNCSVASVTNNAPASLPKGTNTITWTVTDASGNTATATQNVTVVDNVNPAITAPMSVSTNVNPGLCYATGVVLGTPFTTDNCSGTIVVSSNAPVQFPIGQTSVIWTATDGSGNTATATQLVTVTDNINPTITAPATVQRNVNPGVCYATNVPLGNPVAADNCSFTVTNNAPTQFAKGTTVVTWTVTDGAGNTATATQTVTVSDNIAPGITAPQAVVVNVNAGQCYATGVTLGGPATSDNCSGVVGVTNNAPSQFPKGVTTVTWTATDASGNTATATQLVTVNDNINPTITAPANVSKNVNAGLCYATSVVLGTPVYNDNCPGATVTNNAPSQFAKGNTTVIWTITDASGNTATANQTVTVVDNITPTITAPAAITVNSNAGVCYATGVTLGTPVTADNCTGLVVTNNAPSQFPKGNTTVTWTVTDGAGLTASATQVVTVIDNIPPAITAPAAVSKNVNAGQCYATGVTLGTATATDNCTGTVTVTNNAPTQFPKGTTTVTWTATDVSGNTATATQVVTVIDNILPTITAPSNISKNVNAGVCYATGVVLGTPTYADNCPGAVLSSNAPTQFDKGVTTIIWTVTDASGNTATANQTVTVIDNINPTITAPVAVTVNSNAGVCYATGVTLGTPVTTDNCPGLTIINNAPSQFPKGNTTVTWTVTDGAGLTATATQVVTVIDNIPPIVTAPAAVSKNVNAGQCYATGVTIGTATATDNCTGTVTITNNAPSQYPKGATTVTWTATDVSGNTATATQVVTVVDNILPTITAPANVSKNVNAGLCYATGVVLGTPTYGDNCPSSTVSNNAPSQFNKGVTTVIWTVTDASGNTATANQTVTVTDNIAPTITAPAAVTANPNPGVCYATGVSLGTPVTADNCTGLTVTNNAPAQFPKGNTTVTWTVTDGVGLTATATQIVTVIDNIAPTITAPANVSKNVNSGQCYATSVTLGTPVTSDNCTGTITVTNNAPTQYSKGTTTVTWTATDVSGNTATATQIVTVVDNINPTITAPANVTKNVNAGLCYATSVTLGTPTYADNCPGSAVSNNAPTQFPRGVTTVVWTATDASGNTATANQTVTVVDNILPTITAPANVAKTVNAGQCYATGVTLGTPVTSDNCTVLTVTNNAPTQFNKGTTTVIWTITDAGGNTATANQTVTVTDNILPTITAPATITRNVNSGQCYASGFSLGTPSTSDNCPGVTTTSNAPSQFPIGNTTVTWTATDASGNTATATQLVKVIDNIVPDIDFPDPVLVLANTGQCYATNVPLGTPTVTDNCTFTLSNDAPSSFPAGINFVRWIATDLSLNADTTYEIVVVFDTVRPVLTVPANITLNGYCTPQTLNLGTATATDACGVDTIYNDAPDEFPVGTTTVMWVARDVWWNRDTAYQTVTINAGSVSLTTVKTNVTCNGGSNGAIDLSVTGGTSPYTYSWGSGITTQDRTGIPAGTFNVNVTDSRGCTKSGSYSITQPTAFTTSISSTPNYFVSGQDINTIYLGYGTQSGTMTVTASGTGSPFTYSWAPGSSTSTTINIAPTTTTNYVASITNSAGCVQTVSKTIYVRDPRNGSNFYVCHSGSTISVSSSNVATHLNHGDDLGTCSGNKLVNTEGEGTPSDAHLDVYPNPTTGIFTLELHGINGPITNGDIIITDVSGKIVEKRSIRDGQAYKIQFNLSHMARGVYMVKLVTPEKIYHSKIVVE